MTTNEDSMTTKQTRCSALRNFWALPFGLFLSSCSSGMEDVAPAVERRDSVGVRIVEANRPAWEDSSRWRIDPAPLVDFASGTGDEHLFYRVSGMVRFADGSYAIANGGSHEIRFYSPEGEFRTATGREGEGPGDFMVIRSISLTTSDTLLVFDYSRRMTVLDADGTLVRVVRFAEYVTSIHALGASEVVAVFGYPSMRSYQGSGGMIRQPNALWRYNIAGERLDSIGETAGYQEYMLTVEGNLASSAPLFGKFARIATRGNTIFRGNANSMQIEMLSPSGQLLQVFRLVDYPLDLTADIIAAERAARLGVDPHPIVRQIEDQLPDPESRPAYSQVLVDAEGAIWLRPFLGRSEQGKPETWQVVDSAGTWLGSVEVMKNFRIMSVEKETLAGVWTDTLGVEHPRVHQLSRGS